MQTVYRRCFSIHSATARLVGKLVLVGLSVPMDNLLPLTGQSAVA